MMGTENKSNPNPMAESTEMTPPVTVSMKKLVAGVGTMFAGVLQMLEALCRHWPGPMSLALYLTDTEAQQFLRFVETSAVLSARQDVAYHVVYREGSLYPIKQVGIMAG